MAINASSRTSPYFSHDPLELSSLENRQNFRRHDLAVATVLLSLNGSLAIFFPLYRDASPWAATGNALAKHGVRALADPHMLPYVLLSAPFLLSLPILAATVQFLLAQRLWRVTWILAYGVAYVASQGTLSLLSATMTQYSIGTLDVSGPKVLFALLASVIVLVAGAVIVVRNMAVGVPHDRNSIFALQMAYVAGATYPLIISIGQWNIGAFMSLGTGIGYLALIPFQFRMKARGPRRTHA